jgi:hypothetical protein
MNKKSMAESTLVVLIIVLISAIVLGAATILYAKGMSKSGDIESCRASVVMAAKLKAVGKTATQLNCPRKEFAIGLKDAQLDGKLSEDKVKRIIADEVKGCWYKMSGNSQLNPYDQDILFGSKSICLVCSEVDFSEDIGQQLPTITGFDTFLEQGDYADYFVRSRIVTDKYIPFLFFQKEVDTLRIASQIDTKSTYYIIYSTYSPNWAASDNWLNQAMKAVLGDWQRSVDSYSVIEMIPSDGLGKLECGYLYN